MDGLSQGPAPEKNMLGDPSGLTDTIWDMVVNALGALAISTLGSGKSCSCHILRGARKHAPGQLSGCFRQCIHTRDKAPAQEISS
ncbi:MAG: hypothetical protein IPJ33_04940 [Gammaproteobacteria bacterium]|jgi:hypothetical protein|nr:hypothetical protein [Gammaproteobacteria bacterium]MBP6050768.1 hypothetical protein [Pseudomonadales bacterium]MBK7168319.1 hypothetical protein [Gammaproteobacteria bacterium]MBK7727852.1 hypothetical protein [Gammaproteobacteria bacterium]MBK8309079.1 hypothetical protein [Gammaproteobacteria bacterium]